MVEELSKLVKRELIRTFIWAGVALGTAVALFYIIW